MIHWLIALVTLVVLYKWLNRRPSNFPPGPPTVPILGSLPFIEAKNVHLYLEKIKTKYGPVIGFHFGPKPAVAICGMAEVMEVLKRDEFQGRPFIGRKTGVMFANGEQWKDQRRFSLRHLRDFGFGKTTVNNMILEEVGEFCSKKLKDQRVVQASGIFNISAINILWALIAGSRLSYDDQDFQELLKNLQRLFRQGNVSGGFLNALPFLRKAISLFYELDSDRTERLVRAFLQRYLDEHRATKTDTPRDLFDYYLDEFENPNKKDSFTESVLIEVCRDFFVAGTESSSNTLSFCLMYLILYPEWQKKLAKEIEDNLGGKSPAYEDRSILPQVEAFIAEVLRSNTIAPLTVPHAAKKDTNLNGYFIPKDAFVLVSIWSVLQDKDHWKDPENFRPDRFLDDEGKFIRDPTMIVFGTGPRVCLGETLGRSFVFLFLVSLIQKYKFSVPEGAEEPNSLCDPGFTTAPKPFLVQVDPR